VGVLANKADLEHKFNEEKFRRAYPSIEFYREISLKNGKNIPEVFFEFAKLLYHNLLPTLPDGREEKDKNCNCTLM
jgi:hypothetical protein